MDENKKVNTTKLAYPERTRRYSFRDGGLVILRNVVAVGVSASGTHRLETGDGKLHIVPTGWLHIEIDADDWSL